MSGDPAAYIAAALRVHRQRAERSGGSAPPLARLLEAAFSDRDRHDTTQLGDLAGGPHRVAVTPYLLDFDGTASVLAVSRRTVERLVAEGKLRAVKVNSASRIRVADLDAYVAALDVGHPTDSPRARHANAPAATTLERTA